MKLAVWSPLPPCPSGIADYVAESLPQLARHAEITCVVEDPGRIALPALDAVRCVRPAELGARDLDVYHLGNSPAHGYVYRAALARPGVAFMHEWNLHHLVLRETVECFDPDAYLREMRRAHGALGSFVAEQVVRALGGALLPALYPLGDRVLEHSLAVVALNAETASRAVRRLPGRPVLRLPMHAATVLDPQPSRESCRRTLGLSEAALVVTAPGLATAAKRLGVAIDVAGRLAARFPTLRLVVAGEVDPALPLERLAADAGLGERLIVTGRLSLEDFVRHLVAADVVLSLRFPSYGEMSAALLRAMGVGRPCLVSAGTPAALELPPGAVVPVDLGPGLEQVHLEGVLERLLADESLRQRVGHLARAWVQTHHDPAAAALLLATFLQDVADRRPQLEQLLPAPEPSEGTLLRSLTDEVRWAARDLGLAGVPGSTQDWIGELVSVRAGSDYERR